MSNLRNDPNLPQPRTDLDGNVHNELPEPTSYRDGYVHGRVTEHHRAEDREIAREDNNTAKGLIIGIGVTALVALGIAAMFIFSPREDNDTLILPPAVEDTVPETPVEDTEPANPPTIIDRTRETIREVPVPVPVPQEQPAQPNTNVEAPDVNVTVPSAPSSPQPAPDVTNNTNIEVLPGENQQSPEQSQETAQPDATEAQ